MTNLTSSTLVPVALTDLLFAVHAQKPFESSSKGTIRFDHPIITSDPAIQSHLWEAAAALGTSLEVIEDVLFLMVDDKGKLKTFSPCVKSFEGEVVIAWGKANIPLKSLDVTFVGAEFDIEGQDVLVPVRLNEESKTFTRQQVKKAYLAGTLDTNLQVKSAGGSFAQSIVSLEPGVHLITSAVETVGFNKSVSYNVTINGAQYKAPNKLIKLLTALGVDGISEVKPWALHLGDLVTTDIGGREVTYRQVDHIATQHSTKVDFSAFTFETTPTASKVPVSLLSLDA
jgi:hypothetical protein